MKESDDLLILIKSLTKPEKINFKLFATRNKVPEDGKNLRLFDILDKTKQGVDDIKKQLKDEKLSAQLKIYKHRLYNLIMKSLTGNMAGESIDSQLREQIARVEVLYNKSLYAQARKILLKSKSLAYKYEKYISLLEILRWEKKIISEGVFEDINEQSLAKLYEEEHLIIKKINNINDYWKTHSDMLFHFRLNGAARSAEDMLIYQNLRDRSGDLIKEAPSGYEAQWYFHAWNSNYYLGINDFREIYNSTKKLIAFHQAYPEQLSYSLRRYTNTLFSFLKISLDMKNYREFLETIDHIKALVGQFKEMTENVRSYIAIHVYGWEMVAYLRTGSFDEASSLVPLIHKELSFKYNRVYEFFFHHLLAILLLGTEDFHGALSCTNKILNSSKINLSQNVYSGTRMLELIIHYEIGNTELLPYLAKSIYRHLKNKNKLNQTEEIFIDFIKIRLKTILTQKGHEDAFKELMEKLCALYKKNPMEARFQESTILIPWLQSKIEGRSLQSVMQEKEDYKKFRMEKNRLMPTE